MLNLLKKGLLLIYHKHHYFNVRWAFFFLFPNDNCLWERSDSHYA